MKLKQLEDAVADAKRQYKQAKQIKHDAKVTLKQARRNLKDERKVAKINAKLAMQEAIVADAIKAFEAKKINVKKG